MSVSQLQDTELSEDIRLRLARRKLLPIDRWQIVKALFQARELDPRLVAERDLADWLIAEAEHRPYPAASGGFLSADMVWGVVLSRCLALHTPQPDLQTLLAWVRQPEAGDRYRSLRPDLQRAIADWLAPSAGEAVRPILQHLQQPEAPDGLALGLVLSVVFHPEAQAGLAGDWAAQRERAIGRLEERYFDGKLPPLAQIDAWANAAVATVQHRAAARSPDDRAQHDADTLIENLGACDLAALSDLSPLGLVQRLNSFAAALTRDLARLPASPAIALQQAAQRARDHDLASRQPELQLQLEMAMRLRRWLTERAATAQDAPRSLDEAIADELQTGCFVDWARLTLRRAGAQSDLAAAYARLTELATARREQDAQHFAHLLQAATAANALGKVATPVEHILSAWVAPLAATQPVLVLVMDGMSLAASRELLADLAQHGWFLLQAPARRGAIAAGLAAIPSITAASRCSLLCGRLQWGQAAEERQGFAAHPDLRGCSRKAHPPRLFHKAALRGSAPDALATEVREAIARSEQRVVGVVLNAIDDQLRSGEQLRVRWSQDSIAGLDALLEEARASSRLVILLSDHGCVLEQHTELQPGTGGERWRLPVDDPGEQELAIAGPRVLVEGQQAIAPWTEQLRYSQRKHGYHGGLNPQEMLIPIAALSPSEFCPPGWQEAAVDTPLWWDAQPLRTTADIDLVGSTSPATDLPLLAMLAESATGEPAADWHEHLLQSLRAAHSAGNKPMSVEEQAAFAKVLHLLTANDNRVALNALSRSLQRSPRQTQALVQRLQNLLNVDGYAILQIQTATDEVFLDRHLLGEQFRL